MSKNFELLQEIGGGEELFRTDFDELDTAGALAPVTPIPVLRADKSEREAVSENTPLPGVLVSAEDAPHMSSPRTCEDPGSREGQAPPEPDQIPTEDFPEASDSSSVNDIQSPSIEDLKKSDELGNDGPDRSADGGPYQAYRSILSLFPATSEPMPESMEGHAPQMSNRSFGLTWLDVVKAGVKHWIREATERSKYQSCDCKAIVREEEVKLAQRVFPQSPDGVRRMALFSGIASDSGCVSLCARTADILASRGDGEVCLVDANFESPCLHQDFGVENTHGLAEAVVESSPLSTFLRKTSDSRFWLLPSGKAASQLAFSAIADRLQRRMTELRDRFRYVVIHGGPMRVETCAMQIGRWADGVVLVLEAHCTRRDSAKRIKETLQAANINILGVVLNNRTFPIPEAIYRKL